MYIYIYMYVWMSVYEVRACMRVGAVRSAGRREGRCTYAGEDKSKVHSIREETPFSIAILLSLFLLLPDLSIRRIRLIPPSCPL